MEASEDVDSEVAVVVQTTRLAETLPKEPEVLRDKAISHQVIERLTC